MRLRTRLSAALVAALLLTACATTQVQKARQVSVDIHATLAAIDDAEMALCNRQLDGTCKSAIPAWTTAKHREFSAHMLTALKAGKAVNQAVRSVPISNGAKIDLASVSAELVTLTDLITGVLPASSPVTVAITAAKDAVLKLLPLFLS